MMVHKDSGIKDWPDLGGKTVVTGAGTTDERAIQKLNQDQKMNLKIISANEHSESFLLLQSGRAVAFVMDDILLYGDRMTARRPSDWIVVGTPLAKDAYACMLRKDDPQFEKFVNAVLVRAMASGEAARLYKKWFQSPIPPKGLNLDFPISPDLAAFFKNPNNTPYQ
jgi:glutamate/aspartate transport system substrate-binding protein